MGKLDILKEAKKKISDHIIMRNVADHFEDAVDLLKKHHGYDHDDAVDALHDSISDRAWMLRREKYPKIKLDKKGKRIY